MKRESYKIIIFILILLNFLSTNYAIRNEIKNLDNVSLGGGVDTSGTFIFQVAHKDLILFSESLHSGTYLVLENRRRLIIFENNNKIKARKYKKFIKEYKKHIKDLDDRQTKELLLLNIEMENNLDWNVKTINELIANSLYSGIEIIQLVEPNKELFYTSILFSKSGDTDLLFYIGVTYYLKGDILKAEKFLDIFINTIIYDIADKINDLLFYLDAYYFKLSICLEKYRRIENEDKIKKRLLKNEIYEVIRIVDIMLDITEDKKGELNIRKGHKRILRSIWSNKVKYLKLKEDIEKILNDKEKVNEE